MKKHIKHKQDLKDAFDFLKEKKMPFVLTAHETRPDKGTSRDESWKRLNSLFHRGIVPTYSEVSGLREDEAKAHLQQLFACVYEQKDYYEVESIAGMSIERLNKLIDNCQQFLIQNFGVKADELLTINSTKRITK